MPKQSLPNYAQPPVVETVLGVQFDRLSKLRNGHLGGFWGTLDQSEWPSTGDAPLLGTQFEEFGDALSWARAMQVQFTQDPAYRIQIKNADGTRMIQLQNSRLHFNWMKKDGGVYPHYGPVLKEFLAVLGKFKQFVAHHELGEFRPNQWEVTYLNQIPVGTVWTTPGDWGFFTPLAGIPSIEGLVDGESFGGEWHFVIPDKRGRLHINWLHGKSNRGEEDPIEAIRLNLTARGPIDRADDTGLIDGLNLGQETLVSAFAKFMSKDANDFWGLQNA